jgi:hypothetical protein
MMNGTHTQLMYCSVQIFYMICSLLDFTFQIQVNTNSKYYFVKQSREKSKKSRKRDIIEWKIFAAFALFIVFT